MLLRIPHPFSHFYFSRPCPSSPFSSNITFAQEHLSDRYNSGPPFQAFLTKTTLRTSNPHRLCFSRDERTPPPSPTREPHPECHGRQMPVGARAGGTTNGRGFAGIGDASFQPRRSFCFPLSSTSQSAAREDSIPHAPDTDTRVHRTGHTLA